MELCLHMHACTHMAVVSPVSESLRAIMADPRQMLAIGQQQMRRPEAAGHARFMLSVSLDQSVVSLISLASCMLDHMAALSPAGERHSGRSQTDVTPAATEARCNVCICTLCSVVKKSVQLRHQ